MTPAPEFLLQVLAAVAWSDGELNRQEINLILDQLVSEFADPGVAQPEQWRRELSDQLFAHYDLEVLLKQDPPPQHRELLLRMSYLLIQAGQTAMERAIVPAEKEAYRRLVAWLKLSPIEVDLVEQAAQADVMHHQGQILPALRGLMERCFGRG